MKRVGVVGAGIVGGALIRWLKSKTDHEVRVYDGPKNINDSFDGVEAIFLCLPVHTLPSRAQDLSLIKETIMRYKNHEVPFFIKSTVLPGTSDSLSRLTRKTVIAMPEFLTERYADRDFETHDILCGNPANFEKRIVQEIFLGKKVIFVSNVEAEISKYSHNCFGAMKVHYFNLVYQLAKKHGAHYGNVLAGLFLTKFIETNHTMVPGPDGMLGFGGKCFPKDLRAFVGHLSEMQVPSSMLRRVEVENDFLRHPEVPLEL
jgi:UDP-glucose 6-dehydrogenase